jgi:hypothetical protein
MRLRRGRVRRMPFRIERILGSTAGLVAIQQEG